MAPRRPKTAQAGSRTAQDGPKGPHEASKTAQEGPKRTPKSASRGNKLLISYKFFKDFSFFAFFGSQKTMTAHAASKKTPRLPNKSPRWSQDGPRAPRDGQKRPPTQSQGPPRRPKKPPRAVSYTHLTLPTILLV
eukprot:4405133-Pyramimonas_sp.AAC.1